MTRIEELEQRRAWRQHLQTLGTPEAIADLERLKSMHHAVESSRLGQDVYSSAAGEGQPPLGWRRGSENFDLLRQQVPGLAGLRDEALREYLKPERSGFRAEIYLPDPEILGPGYKPIVAFKGSSGPIELGNGKTRETLIEDFAGVNGPQAIGLQTDYYDRAMTLARDFKQYGVSVDYSGHSLAGGMATAAVAVSGERAVTVNAAPLHPMTTQRFASQNPVLELYDPNPRITAYQVQGELLSDGVVHNIDRLDAFHNKQLADVMRHTSTILVNVPEDARDALIAQIGEQMPAHARVSFGALMNKLAEGDPESYLRDMPLAAGRVVPIQAMKRSDPDDPESAPIPRADVPSLSGVSSFAGPLLELAHREAKAARVGNEVGEWVEIGGKYQAKTLDNTGDAVSGMAGAVADVQSSVSRTMGQTAATGLRMSGEASADVREFAGRAEATVDFVQGEVQARGASAGAAVLRRIGDIDFLPDGIQRWANREASELQQAGTAARERNMGEAADALRDASQEARQIRENLQFVAQTLDAVTVRGSQNQHDAIAYAGKSVDQVLDIAGDKLAQVSGYAPTAGAVALAGASLKANTIMSHDDPASIARSMTFAGLGFHSGKESFNRHLNDTAVPSIEAKVDAFESSLLVKYPSLSAKKNERDDEPSRESEAQQRGNRPAPPLMTEPAHPAHLMYQQAQSAIAKVEAAPGMGLTQHDKQTLGASVVAEALTAKGWNFTRVDHVVPSNRIDPQTGRPEAVFVVQGDLNDPAHRRISINVEQALSQTIEQSSSVAQTVQQTRQETMELQQSQAEGKGMDGPKGPVMRMGARALSSQNSDMGDGGGGE